MTLRLPEGPTGPALRLLADWRENARLAERTPGCETQSVIWDAAAEELQALLDTLAPLDPGEREVVWKAGFMRGGSFVTHTMNGGWTLFPDEQAVIWTAAHRLYPAQRPRVFTEAAEVCQAHHEEQNRAAHPPDLDVQP